MATVKNSQAYDEIQKKKEEVAGYLVQHSAKVNGLVPSIVSSKVSSRKVWVGWRFETPGDRSPVKLDHMPAGRIEAQYINGQWR